MEWNEVPVGVGMASKTGVVMQHNPSETRVQVKPTQSSSLKLPQITLPATPAAELVFIKIKTILWTFPHWILYYDRMRMMMSWDVPPLLCKNENTCRNLAAELHSSGSGKGKERTSSSCCFLANQHFHCWGVAGEVDKEDEKKRR